MYFTCTSITEKSSEYAHECKTVLYFTNAVEYDKDISEFIYFLS
jgi:hypothetical protein